MSYDDQTDVARVTFSYELPFGKGKPFLSGGLASHVMGGWSFAGVMEYASGTAMFRLVRVQLALRWREPGVHHVLRQRAGGNSGGKFDPFKDVWWNKSAFHQAPQGILDTELGNATGNNPKVRTPWFLNENVSIARNVPIKEQIRLVFRFEAFNLFNRVRWGGPDSTLASANFGLMRGQGNSPRQMQAALKLSF